MARTRRTTVCPRTRSAGMVMVYRPCALTPTEMFISVMKAFAFSSGWPDADVIRPVNVAGWAPWACALGAPIERREHETATSSGNRLRIEQKRFMITSDRGGILWQVQAVRLVGTKGPEEAANGTIM